MRRRDSASAIERINSVDGAYRCVILPRDFQFVASSNPAIRTEALGDGRWRVIVEVEELAGMVVDTIRQIRDNVGRVSDRRYALIRALATDEEWQQAEEVVVGVDLTYGGTTS